MGQSWTREHVCVCVCVFVCRGGEGAGCLLLVMLCR
jgi:hypothetical protein